MTEKKYLLNVEIALESVDFNSTLPRERGENKENNNTKDKSESSLIFNLLFIPICVMIYERPALYQFYESEQINNFAQWEYFYVTRVWVAEICTKFTVKKNNKILIRDSMYPWWD